MSQAEIIESTGRVGPAICRPLAPKKQRKLIENAIERLVDLLDEIEADPDLEDNADGEPSLGWPEDLKAQRLSDGSDLEMDTADDEPSLGSLNSCGGMHQGCWAGGNTDDREKTGYATDSDDDEPSMGWSADVNQACLYSAVTDGEDEPSLGWTAIEARFGRYGDSGCDLEEQCEDEGAQCDDEGALDCDRELDEQGFTNPDSAQYNTPR